ncbi:MAG: ISMt2 transposase [Mycobacterium sp.]|nr:ISMt2 transposase [Mycobacterium sp.]
MEGRQSASLTRMQADAARWCGRWPGSAVACAGGWAAGAGVRRDRAARVDRVAAHRLRAHILVYRRRRGGSHPKVCRAPYSLPCWLIGQRPHARTAGNILEIFADGDVVATPVQRPRGRATSCVHYSLPRPLPPAKSHARFVPGLCQRTAGEIGPACGAVLAEFMYDSAMHRPALGPGGTTTRQPRMHPAGGHLRPRHRGWRPRPIGPSKDPGCRHGTQHRRHRERLSCRRPGFAARIRPVRQLRHRRRRLTPVES